MSHTIVISRNTAWSLYNYHSGLIKELLGCGYYVTAAALDDGYSCRLKDSGCRFIGLPMDNHGTNPGRDLLLLLRYVDLLRSEKPSVYLSYTIKPNVYGSLAAHMLGIPVINNISGLGITFAKDNVLTQVVKGLYKCALCRSAQIYFQNADNQELFIEKGMVRREVTDRVPGSGIDLTRYAPAPPRSSKDPSVHFLVVARMIKHKGIGEYVNAARIVRRRFPDTEFQLLGILDKGDPNAISDEEIRSWEDEGVIQYFGRADDVRPFIANADCVVLPSDYPEGVPHSLLEAAAMARPIITTDAVGCRNVVDEGVNGFLCHRRNPESLAERMIQLIGLSPQRRVEMGEAGRRKVEREFDEEVVIQKYMNMISHLVNAKVPGQAIKHTSLAAKEK